jgi:cytochrome c biogenesis protein CcmG/thiol:disulfide interchange protein DsbE
MSAEPRTDLVERPGRRRLLGRAGRLLALLAVGGFVAVLAYGVLTQPADTTIDDGLAQGELPQAPGFELGLLERGDPGPALAPVFDRAVRDGRVDLDELRGRPVVLNFWASWCIPCREEAPVLERAWKEARRQGVLFLGLDVRDLRDEARAFLREFRLTYPSVRDGGGDSMRPWGVTGIPETFFLTADRRVAGHIIGAVTDEQLDQGIAAARAKRPAAAGLGGARQSVQ